MHEVEETEAILLEKFAYGSRSTKMLAITEKFGVIDVYQRRSSYDYCDYVDVFDQVLLVGNMKRDKIMFANECVIVRSYKSVVSTYDSFICISKFFLLIKKIVEPGFRCEELFDLSKNLLMSTSKGSDYKIAVLKSLYILSRIEGVNFKDFLENFSEDECNSLIFALKSKPDVSVSCEKIDFFIEQMFAFIEANLS